MVSAGTDSVSGRITVSFSVVRGVELQGEITGLAPGKHAFHVHEGSGTGNSCADAGPHFYPDAEQQDYNLGALETSAAGATPVSRTAPDFSLGDGRPQDIAGRTLVVHAEESGGARVACGIITLI